MYAKLATDDELRSARHPTFRKGRPPVGGVAALPRHIRASRTLQVVAGASLDDRPLAPGWLVTSVIEIAAPPIGLDIVQKGEDDIPLALYLSNVARMRANNGNGFNLLAKAMDDGWAAAIWWPQSLRTVLLLAPGYDDWAPRDFVKALDLGFQDSARFLLAATDLMGTVGEPATRSRSAVTATTPLRPGIHYTATVT